MASARMLLAHNCDPWQKTAKGRTALHTAARKGCLDVCKLFSDAAGSEPDVRDSNDCTPLAEAVRMGHLAVVKLLHAQHGCDVMMQGLHGVTLLHVAAGADKPPMLEYLIRSGVDVNAATSTAVTPVRVAVQKQHAAAVKTLLEQGASTAAVHAGGESLLSCAIMLGNAKIVEVILSQCKQLAVELNARNADLHTVLHEAALYNRTEAAAVLLRFGAAVDARAAYVTTPLMAAARYASTDLVQLLLDPGAEITAQSVSGVTVLHTAANNIEHPEVLQLLLEQSGAIAIIDNLSVQCNCCGLRTALMLCEQPAHLKLLLAAGADVHITTDRGNTALHVSAVHKFTAPVLCLLIKAGVDLHAVNASGKTAAQVAAERGNKLAAALLTRAARDS
jgi:ankyrin repeat protein